MRCKILVLLLLCVQSMSAATLAEKAEAIRQDPTVEVRHQVTVACPVEVITELMQRPDMAAELWAAFGMTPEYRVSEAGAVGDFHIDDPTGIGADLWPLAGDAALRRYLAEGRFDHWAVQGLVRASAALEVQVSDVGGGETLLAVSLAVKAESWVDDVDLGLLETIMERRATARIEANLTDAKWILEAVADRPRGVAGKMARGAMKKAFVRRFVLPVEAGGAVR